MLQLVMDRNSSPTLMTPVLTLPPTTGGKRQGRGLTLPLPHHLQSAERVDQISQAYLLRDSSPSPLSEGTVLLCCSGKTQEPIEKEFYSVCSCQAHKFFNEFLVSFPLSLCHLSMFQSLEVDEILNVFHFFSCKCGQFQSAVE